MAEVALDLRYSGGLDLNAVENHLVIIDVDDNVVTSIISHL